MKGLFVMADTLITDLIALSDPTLMTRVGEDIDGSNLLAAMFGVLATTVEFKDLRSSFQRMNMEQLVRITLPYLEPREQADSTDTSE